MGTSHRQSALQPVSPNPLLLSTKFWATPLPAQPARPAQRRARHVARLPRRQRRRRQSSARSGRSTRWPRRACRACSVDAGGLKTPVEHAGRPSGGPAADIAKLGTGWRRRETPRMRFTAARPRALPGPTNDFLHDQGCLRDRLEPLSTAAQPVVRIIAVADRVPPVALSAARRAPRRRPRSGPIVEMAATCWIRTRF